MSTSLTLMLVAGVLLSAGVYLMMERSLTRILVGVLLTGNGVNLLFIIASGDAGAAPFVGRTNGRGIADPLPQAMVLTAIVITLGLTAFLLTMAYRSFQLNGHDEVADDVEDRKIRELAEADEASASYDADDHSLPSEDDSDPDPTGEGLEDPHVGDAEETDDEVDSAEVASDRIVASGERGSVP